MIKVINIEDNDFAEEREMETSVKMLMVLFTNHKGVAIFIVKRIAIIIRIFYRRVTIL